MRSKLATVRDPGEDRADEQHAGVLPNVDEQRANA
jgi:hypothetical protein